MVTVLGARLVTYYFPRANHPSDESLVANFQSHRANFEKLVTMANEDRDVRRIFPDEVMLVDYRTWPEPCAQCFSWQRWAEYQEIFAGLGVEEPYFLSKDSDMVRITTSFESTETESEAESIISEKGYAYLANEPAGLVESLNGMGFETKGTYYKRIARNWYLYHEWGVSKPE